jgi:hypothetical protein
MPIQPKFANIWGECSVEEKVTQGNKLAATTVLLAPLAYSAHSSTMKMEAVHSFESSKNFYQTTWGHSWEDSIFKITAVRTSNLTKLLTIWEMQFLILWHVDPLLGNDRKTNNWTTAVTGQRPVNSIEERCFLGDPCWDVKSMSVSEEFSQLVEMS